MVLRRQRHRDQWPAGPSLHTKSLRWLRRSDGSDAAASACEDDTKLDGGASVEFEAPDNRYVLERSAGERADTEDQLKALCQALSKPQLSADAEESARDERQSRSVSPTTSRGPRSSHSAPMSDMELLEGSYGLSSPDSAFAYPHAAGRFRTRRDILCSLACRATRRRNTRRVRSLSRTVIAAY